ncbi:MAG TPA: outer membrane beta-barrel protein [Bryobacteraceae bacterium]|nr:outer membrane beta-barrel protein [Bryobacteraceae bacterium]
MHRLILLACTLTTAFAAERIFSFGIKGGVPLTDAFSDHTITGIDTVTRTFSDSKNYVIGPMVELNLPFGFSVEADALYRPLNLTTDVTVVPQPFRRSVTDINAWEFPILGKYHFLHTPIVKPYVEAGPIFRHVGSDASQLSNSGFALGGGIDLKLLLVKITPELRFSRFGGDATIRGFIAPPSNQNQAEFLIGLSF